MRWDDWWYGSKHILSFHLLSVSLEERKEVRKILSVCLSVRLSVPIFMGGGGFRGDVRPIM